MAAAAIRAFVAIELSPELQAKIDDIITELQKQTGKSVRWVTPRNVHLTLKFIGNVSPANLSALTHIICAEALRHKPFVMKVESLGAFPNLIRPRIIWVGIQSPSTLSEIQRGIDRETNRLGYPGEERDFSPHLTLGRISQHAGPQEVKQIADTLHTVTVGVLGSVHVDSIRLFRSDLQPGGAIYTPLLSAPLSK